MHDEIAIQQTLNSYSEAVSRRDWNQLLATFAPGGVWEIPSLKARFDNPTAMQQVMSGFVDQMAYFIQINSPAAIEVSGSTATARCVIREAGKFSDRDVVMEVFGRYEDELVKTAEGWKFARRIFHGMGQHTYALLPPNRAASPNRGD